MSRVRERRNDSRHSELMDLKYQYYRELRDGKIRLKTSGRHYFLCPYCPDSRREYELVEELERHAYRISEESRSFRDRARHMALRKYLNEKSSSSSSRPTRRDSESYRDEQSESKRCTPGTSNSRLELRERVTEHDCRNRSSPRRTQRGTPRRTRDPNNDPPIVWPWTGIIANIPIELKDGKYVAESGRKLKEELVAEGFNPIKIHPLWDFRGHSGFAAVEFKRDWEGFSNAMEFEQEFEKRQHGKKDWHSRNRGDDKQQLYGWLARGEEYLSEGVIGRHLRKNGDLKTVAEIQLEDQRKDTALVSKLSDVLLSKSEKSEAMKKRISRKDRIINNLLARQEEMTQSYNEEMKTIQDDAYHQLQKIMEDSERTKAELENRRQRLKLREKELKQRRVWNDTEKAKFEDENKMNERAIAELKKHDEERLKLALEHKRENDQLHKRIIELEAVLDNRQALELELERIRGYLEMRKCMIVEGDVKEKEEMRLIEQEMTEKEEELEMMDNFTQALIIKDRKANDELQDARKELIKGLQDSRAQIRVKWMGELVLKPFVNATRRKHEGEKVKLSKKARELCSLWKDQLGDPHWHPFKVVKEGGNDQEVIDEEDEKVKELRELGDEVFDAVTGALKELNEHNPSGRYPVMELWNSNQNRKATLIEGVEHIQKLWNQVKKGKKGPRRN